MKAESRGTRGGCRRSLALLAAGTRRAAYLFCCTVMLAGTARGATILSQNFSTDPVNYTLPGSSDPFRYYDGPRYWAKSDMPGLTVNAAITGSDGAYLGAQNLNDGGFTFSAASPAQIDFTVSVAGYSDLKLSIKLAGLPNAESDNFIRLKTDNDGNGVYETTIFNFAGVAGGVYTDTTLGALTAAFKTFANLGLPTPTAPDGKLRLRIESYNDTDSANEATGIDTILISGTPPSPPSGAPVIQNLPATNVTTGSAWFNGWLVDTGSSACAVCVLWGKQNGSTNWGAWANTNWFDGTGWATNTTFTTNITPLDSDSDYFYTYAATNATTNAIASPSKYFITGYVTVEATDTNAQFKTPIDTGTFTISRPAGATNGDLSVAYTITGETAPGDHNLPSGNATIPAGQTNVNLVLTPTLTGVGDAVLMLTALSTNAYPIGAMNSATVTIQAADIATEIFVSTNGTHVSPFSTWATAATNIQAAIDASAGFPTPPPVTVSNGTYTVASNVVLSTANMILRSFGNGVTGGLANASNTVVKVASGFHRALAITRTNCLVDGFMLTGGGGNLHRTDIGADGGSGGSGLYMTADSLVRNCIVTNNGGDNVEGVGVYMSAGTVSNCIIRSNNKTAGGGHGGGVYASGGLITHCQITDNTIGGTECNGGGVYVSGATVRNCLIQGNKNLYTTATYGLGGGVYLASGIIESCTIVSNSTTSTGVTGGGIHRAAGAVSNSIVYFNTVTNTVDGGMVHSNLNTTVGFYYSCSTNPALSGNGNISDDPKFVNLAAGDYTLLAGSPCIDKGTNQTWMIGATDLAGAARKRYGGVAGSKDSPVVDMGAYEASGAPTAGTMILVW